MAIFVAGPAVEGCPWYPLPLRLLMEPHLPRHRASRPCRGLDEHHGPRAAAPPCAPCPMAVHRGQWGVRLYTTAPTQEVHIGGSFFSPSHCGQWAGVAPCIHRPTAMGSWQWWLLLYTDPLLWAAGSVGPAAQCNTAMGRGQCKSFSTVPHCSGHWAAQILL